VRRSRLLTTPGTVGIDQDPADQEDLRAVVIPEFADDIDLPDVEAVAELLVEECGRPVPFGEACGCDWPA